MKKFIFLALFCSTLFGDTSLGVVINSSNGNNQFNSPRNYQQRYPNFNYNRDAYYNDDGLYFGFFNNKGYYVNDIYFEYRDRYGYYDRLHRRGYFRPHIRHVRYYDYYRDRRGDYVDNTNCYVEEHHYYNRHPHYRRHHHPYRRHYRDYGRVVEHRYDNRDYYRDDRRYHGDNAKVIYERHPEHR
ncbi:MAG: hypothetical protein KN64_03080 [Sulfurovum sp. AS07-7]|nr:MAG: hypothetical protein KN64_03080 [Sulfurovum sp. AS07-7]